MCSKYGKTLKWGHVHPPLSCKERKYRLADCDDLVFELDLEFNNNNNNNNNNKSLYLSVEVFQ